MSRRKRRTERKKCKKENGWDLRKEHMGGLEILPFAVVEVEHQVVFQDVVAGGEAECAGSLIDGGAGTLQFHEVADGGFVEVDDQALGPGEASGEAVRSTEFLVAEPSFEPEAFEDALQGGRVGERQFDLLADLVATVGGGSGGGADGELVRRGFEGEEGTRPGFLGLVIAEGRPFEGARGARRRGCGADAKELAVFGKAAVGGVEDEVVFVNARRGGLGAEFFERAEKGFDVDDTELDFGFARHERKEGYQISDIRDWKRGSLSAWVSDHCGTGGNSTTAGGGWLLIR